MDVIWATQVCNYGGELHVGRTENATVVNQIFAMRPVSGPSQVE